MAASAQVSVSSQAPTSAFSLNRCVGKRNYHLSSATNWFGFNDRPISRDTRCQYCATHLKMIGEANLYGLASHSSQIDCDSLDDAVVSKLDYNNFLFSVRSPDGQTPFLVHPEKADARRHGVLVVEMPEVQDYAVEIDPRRSAFDADNYYTFDMSVGDRKVVINDGRLIYYNGKTKVSGFTTGTNDSFRFVAEKRRGDFAGESGINAPNTNLITIRVQTFRRERPRRLFMEPQPVYRSFGSRGFSYGSEYESERESLPRGFSFRSNSLKKKSGSRASAAAASDGAEESFDGSPDFGSAPAVTGGSTVSGHQHVSDVSTTTTSDRFVPTGNFVVTIQLVHFESDRYQNLLFKDRANDIANEEARLRERLRAEQDRILERQRAFLLGTNAQQTVVQTSPMVPLVPAQPAQPVPVQTTDVAQQDLVDGFTPVGSS